MHGHIMREDIPQVKHVLAMSEIIQDLDGEAPKIRAECINGPRPCPWIRCKWHAIWYIKAVKSSRPFRALSDQQIVDIIAGMEYSCVLDVCDQGGATLDLVGEVLQTTRERIRQIEGCTKMSIDGTKYPSGAMAQLRVPSRYRMLKMFSDYDVDRDQEYIAHAD